MTLTYLPSTVFNNTAPLDDVDSTINVLAAPAYKTPASASLVFNVILVDNEYIHRLNLEYRGIDRPTDVITFALEDVKDIEYDNMRLLGDIYISLDKAREQALEYGHSFLRELSFLAVHGFLHLLGYDHMNPEDEKEMFTRQEEILNGFGI